MWFNPKVVTWPMFFTFVALVMHVVFLTMLAVVEWAVNQNDEDMPLRKKYSQFLVEDNYWYCLVWYHFVDDQYLFNSGLEHTIYFLHFWIQANICAGILCIESVIKDRLDNQINNFSMNEYNFSRDKVENENHSLLIERIYRINKFY